MAEYTTVTNITSGNIGNALHSVAIDHVVAIAKDIYDTEFVRAGGKGGYQSEINSGFSESLNELSANTNALLNELSANTDAHFNVVESALTDFSANTNTHFGILDEHTDDLLDRCSGFTYMTNDEYAYAIVDPNGIMLFGIRYNGDVVYNTGMSDEVRGRLNELEGVQVMQNDQYIFAILDEQQNVLFGIKADGTVVEPKNEFDAKIEKVQKKANENYSFCVALSAVTIALQEQIDAMSASTSEAIDKLVDFDNTISAVTEHISGLTETLSGVSDATVERLHDFDGWNLVEGDFMLGVADINGYQLLKIDNSGKTFVGNGLVVYGEKAGLDVMDVNNYVYAVTDSEDKVLFGVTTNGASVINKSLTFNDLGGEFTIMEDTPEWAYVIQDANKNVVFGIGLDGDTYIPKGMSEDTKARFKELEGIQVFDNSENWNIVFADPNGNIPFGITTDGTTFIAKGIPEDSKVKFNEIKKRFEQIEGIQVLENTDNFMYAIVDSENTVVFGIKPDGSTYSPKGIPADVQSRFDELEPIEVLAETANYLFAFVDQEGKVPFGIMSDGTTFIAKGMSEDTKARFKELEGIQVWENTEGWIYAIADSDRNVLFGIQDDGTTYMPKGIPQDVQEKLDEFQYSIMHDETYIYAITDKKGLVLFGIDNSGRTIVNDITGNIGTMETVESDKFVYAIYDQAGNVLFAILTDGSVWVSQFDVSVLSGMSLNSQYLQEFEDEEFIHIVNDKEGKIVFGVTWDGTTYIPKGIPEDTKAEIKRIDKSIGNIQNDIADLYTKINDWSDAESLRLPMPRACARVEITGTIPPSKYTEVSGVLTYNDMDGNTFTKPIVWSRQGNISAGFDKPNFGIDLLVSTVPDDEGALLEFPIKFGDWPEQDSYHLKAYYSDFWKIRSLGSYHHAEDIAQARDIWDQRPWDKFKYGAAQQTSGATGTAVKGGVGVLESDMRTGALGHPDGFPFMLYINGLPYGLYTWNLKKHKDNYMITKNDVTGNEVFFGDRLYGYFNRSNYGFWNLSNTNLQPSVVSEAGNNRTTKSSGYTTSKTVDIIFDHAASNDEGIQLSITNSAGTTTTKEVYYKGNPVTTNNTWKDGEYVRLTYNSTLGVFDTAKDSSNNYITYDKWNEDSVYVSGQTVYDVDVFDFEVSGNTSEVTMYRSFVAANNFIYDSQKYPCYANINPDTGEATVGSRILSINTLKPSTQWWGGFDIKYPKEKLARNYDGLDENGYKKFKYEMFDYDSPSNYASTGIYERSHELCDGEYEFWGAKKTDTIPGKTNLNGLTLGDGTAIKENLFLRSVAARKTVIDYQFSMVLLSYTLAPKNIFEWGFMPNSTESTYEDDYYALSSSERTALQNAVKKEIFDEHHDVDYTIDYFIITQNLCYYDSITHNTLYTMYDGKHLVPNVYDMDITMGMSSTYINSFPAVSTGNVQLTAFVGAVWTYHQDEIKERYKKYRKMGAISQEKWYKVVYDMVNAIGFSNYETENKLWSQPAYRGPVYWKMPAGSIQPIYNKSGVFKNWGYDESLNKALPTANSWSSAETVNVSYPLVVDTIGDHTVYSGITEGVAGATILSTAFVPEQTDKGTDADNTDQTVSATLMAPGVTIPSTMHIVIANGNITVTQVTDAAHTNWDGDPVLKLHTPVELTGVATNIEATSHAAGKKFSFTADLQLKSADNSIIINTTMSCAVTGGGKLTPSQGSVSAGSTLSPGEVVFSGVTILSATTDGGVTNLSGRTQMTGVNTGGVNLNGSWTVFGTTDSNGECSLTVSARSGNVRFLEDLTLTGTVNGGSGSVAGAAGSGITYQTGTTVNDGAHYYICQVAHTAKEEFKPSNAYTCGNPVGGVYDSPRRTYEWLLARMNYLDALYGYQESDITLEGLNDTVNVLTANVDVINERIGNMDGIQVLYNTGNYLYAIVDQDSHVLFAIEPDGNTYIAKGIPEDVQTAIDEINERISGITVNP